MAILQLDGHRILLDGHRSLLVRRREALTTGPLAVFKDIDMEVVSELCTAVVYGGVADSPPILRSRP